MVHHAAGSYRGNSKTDAKDAAIIADQARMRRDLHAVRAGDEISIELSIPTSRRTDLMRDRTRIINPLRPLLSTYFPALERTLDISNVKATLILLSGYQTPDGTRRFGQARLEAWLRKRKAYNVTQIAAKAIAAAQTQHARVAGQDVAARTVAKFAVQVMNIDAEMAEIDRDIEERFTRHHHAEVIESMPGFGQVLGAELLAATGGDLAAFGTPDRLTGIAVWPRCLVIRVGSAEIYAGPGATIAACCGYSACPRS